jgi:hypothetical protein
MHVLGGSRVLEMHDTTSRKSWSFSTSTFHVLYEIAAANTSSYSEIRVEYG